MLLDDSGGDGSSRKESRLVKIVVSLQEDVTWKEVSSFTFLQEEKNAPFERVLF